MQAPSVARAGLETSRTCPCLSPQAAMLSTILPRLCGVPVRGRDGAPGRRSCSRRDPEGVHDLAGRPLAALDTAVQEALAERRGVLAGEMDRPLTEPQGPPEVGVLPRADPRVRSPHPRVVHP